MVTKAAGISDFYTYRVTWSENDKEYVGLCHEIGIEVTEIHRKYWLVH